MNIKQKIEAFLKQLPEDGSGHKARLAKRFEAWGDTEFDKAEACYRALESVAGQTGGAYACVLPSKRYKAVSKETGKTCYIERLNNIFLQRISRLVRKTLSFSKKLEHHKAAIWNFIHHYNASLKLSLLP